MPRKGKSGKNKPPGPRQTVQKRALKTGSIERTTMRAHYYYQTTLVSTGTGAVKQINLLPSLSDFDQLINQAQFYQQYSMLKCQYKLAVVNAMSSMCGTRLPAGSSQPSYGLLDVFRVRLQSNQVPEQAIKNYMAYNNVRHDYSNHEISGSFVPYVSVSQGESRTFKAGARISTDNLIVAGYGQSILFHPNDVGIAPSTYLISGVVTLTVLFDHYDGIQLSSLGKQIRQNVQKKRGLLVVQPEVSEVEQMQEQQQWQQVTIRRRKPLQNIAA